MGCTTLATVVADCNAGEDWEHWSHSHKLRCCKSASVACERFDCHSGAAAMWTDEKKTWCCAKKHLGCDLVTDAPNCHEDVEDWDLHWSNAKKMFCCNRYGV